MNGEAFKRIFCSNRAPDFVIGESENPYLRRWWLYREEKGPSVYLHQILRDDDDRALHDHPWDNVTLVLDGIVKDVSLYREKILGPGEVLHRRATDAHRLEVECFDQGCAWTLFVTGPKVREWGFLCQGGWRHWKTFVKPENPGEVGLGCGEFGRHKGDYLGRPAANYIPTKPFEDND